jgi:hypothetical protein
MHRLSKSIRKGNDDRRILVGRQVRSCGGRKRVRSVCTGLTRLNLVERNVILVRAAGVACKARIGVKENLKEFTMRHFEENPGQHIRCKYNSRHSLVF